MDDSSAVPAHEPSGGGRFLCALCRERPADCGGTYCGFCWCEEYGEDYYRLKNDVDEFYETED